MESNFWFFKLWQIRLTWILNRKTVKSLWTNFYNVSSGFVLQKISTTHCRITFCQYNWNLSTRTKFRPETPCQWTIWQRKPSISGSQHGRARIYFKFPTQLLHTTDIQLYKINRSYKNFHHLLAAYPLVLTVQEKQGSRLSFKFILDTIICSSHECKMITRIAYIYACSYYMTHVTRKQTLRS